jgi:thiamine-phosphate pyrophosphorylase
MSTRCLLYYITDRTQFPGNELSRRRRVLEKIGEGARCGVDYIQLREKDLPTRELERLAIDALSGIREASSRSFETRDTARVGSIHPSLLINSRTDVALAVGADGVHLRSDDVPPSVVRQVWCRDRRLARPLVTVSCHSPADVLRGQENGADFAVFAPVFEKQDLPELRPAGLESLRRACQYKIPVFALGGITLENAGKCLAAGATGIAGIRLFQENEIAEVVSSLCSL